MSKSGIPIVKDVAKVGGQIIKPLAPVLKTVAPILPFLPIPGLGPLSALATRSLLTGIASGLDKSGNFNFNRGLKAGALAYGVGSLMNAANANTLTSTGETGSFDMGGNPDVTSAAPATTLTPSGDVSLTSSYTGVGSIPATAPASISSGISVPSPALPAGQTVAPITDLSTAASSLPTAAPVSTAEGIANLAGAAGETAMGLGSRAVDYAMKNPVQAAFAATQGVAAYKTKQELDAAKEEADRILRDQQNKKASEIAWAQGVLRDYPIQYQRLTAADVRAQMGMARGGLTALAGGGRFLEGPGDGTSDSIPARIGGKQEARLADGEFVVDARTVSELGNGSSKAGAKKLYAMMDRVHAARRGAKRGKPSGADKYMPA